MTVLKELDEIRTFKRCTMCDAEYTKAGWRKLHLLGYQDLLEDEPPIELRNCPCGTTLAIECDGLSRPC